MSTSGEWVTPLEVRVACPTDAAGEEVHADGRFDIADQTVDWDCAGCGDTHSAPIAEVVVVP